MRQPGASTMPPEATGGITVAATVDRLGDVLDLIHDELCRHKCPIAIRNQLDLVIEELFVNVCSYAYEEPGECRVEYVYSPDPRTITVSIEDRGIPFDPLAHADPDKPSSVQEAPIGGLGIFMAKRISDSIAYRRDGDTNITTFTKGW